MDRPIVEIKRELNMRSNDKLAKKLKSYMVSNYRFYGIKVPLLRKIIKKYDFDEELVIELLNSEYFEEVCMGLFMLSNNKKIILKNKEGYWRLLEKFIDKVDNWCHSDYSCNIRNAILQKEPERIKELKLWAFHPNLWKRRAALITLVKWSKGYKITASKEDAFYLLDKLIHDKEFYVHRALGWILRDLSVQYPKEVFKYIQQHNSHIAAVTRATAMEKLKKQGYTL